MKPYDIAFDFQFETPLQRLVMVCVHISGSGDGGNEKIITDRALIKFCCCKSSELISTMNYLVESGFLLKNNLGMQLGEAASGYTLCVPDDLRGADE